MVELDRDAVIEFEPESERNGRLLTLSRRQLGVALVAFMLHVPLLARFWNSRSLAIRYQFNGPFPPGEAFVVKTSEDVTGSPIRGASISISPKSGHCSFGFAFCAEQQSGNRIEVVVDAKDYNGQTLHSFRCECFDVRSTRSRIVKGTRIPATRSPGKSVSGRFPESLVAKIHAIEVSVYTAEGDA